MFHVLQRILFNILNDQCYFSSDLGSFGHAFVAVMGKLQKLDNRIQLMLQHGVNQNYRTVLVIIGNKGQDQVPILYQLQTQIQRKGILKILWCYKKDLSFST